MFIFIGDKRFELLTSRTPCARATGLRQSPALKLTIRRLF